MSVLSLLESNLSNFQKIIEHFENELEKAEQHLTLKNKSLHDANVEQPAYYVFYSQLHEEVKTLERFIENRMLNKKGKLWRDFKEHHSIQLSSTDITNYIEGDKDYAKLHTYSLIIGELVGNYASVVKAFEQRGYALKNLTLMRVHEIQQAIL